MPKGQCDECIRNSILISAPAQMPCGYCREPEARVSTTIDASVRYMRSRSNVKDSTKRRACCGFLYFVLDLFAGDLRLGRARMR